MEIQEYLKTPGRRVEADSEISRTFFQNNQVILAQIREKMQKISAAKSMDFSSQEFKGWNERFIGAMVTQFDFAPQNAFALFIRNLSDYLVCLKSDGLRYLLAVFSSGTTILVDRENNIFEVSTDLNTRALATEDTSLGCIEYIIDGELVLNVSPFCPKEKLHFQIFDCVLYKRSLLVDKNCLERLRYARLVLNQTRFLCRDAGEGPAEDDSRIHVYLKDFYAAKHTGFVLQTLAKIPPYVDNIDGLIFTKINYPYYPGRNLGMIKWKHERMNTIDFLIVGNPDLLQLFPGGIPQEPLFIFELYVTNRDRYLLFDYLFIFSEEAFVDLCKCFKQMTIGGVTFDGAILECMYNKTETNGVMRNFYEAFYDMSSDALVALIKRSKLAHVSNLDHDSIRCLLVAFEQRKQFEENTIRGNWEGLRFRADKSYPNSLATANNVYESIFEKNISEARLIETIASGRV